MQVENGGRLLLVGDLEDEPGARGILQVEVLIALAGERRGNGIQVVKFARKPDGIFNGEARRFFDSGHKNQGISGAGSQACPREC